METHLGCEPYMLMDVAGIVPGFGGMYVNEEEKLLYVYSVGKGDAAALGRAISTVFGPEIVPSGGVRVIPGTYTLPQLFGWYQLINKHVFSLPDVTATDLQEAGNYLWVGIKDESVRAQVETEIQRFGIPREAVIVEVSTPVIAETHTLLSAVRPVDAGVQITNENSGNTCTFGFSALLNGGGPGMVTNSHCTRNMGTVDSDKFHQPVVSGTTNLVGVEAIDPPLFNTSPCPAGKLCRYSDSVFVTPTGNLTLNRGYIAKPTGLTTDYRFPIRTIDHNTPRFRITSTGTAAVGYLVEKVGKRTGWTRGQVVATCKNVTNSDNGYVMLCQNETSYVSYYGDSGSPVFYPVNASDVKLVGIHWGWSDPAKGGNGNAFYSTIEKVQSDLAPGGTLQVCASGFSC